MIISPIHILPYPFPTTVEPNIPIGDGSGWGPHLPGHPDGPAFKRPAPDLYPAPRNCWDPRTWGVKVGGHNVNLVPQDDRCIIPRPY
jgi:hypothetical protein